MDTFIIIAVACHPLCRKSLPRTAYWDGWYKSDKRNDAWEEQRDKQIRHHTNLGEYETALDPKISAQVVRQRLQPVR